jgi:phosphoserine phosphatase
MSKKVNMAICYDFDGTLSPSNMQEYNYIPDLGIKPDKFWQESREKAKINSADPILMYMKLMLEKAHDTTVKVTKKSFSDYGRTVELFDGVEGWFDRINAYASELNINVEHYIISSGIKEMIEGTKIKKKFKQIFACSFIYDNNGAANWPAVAVNYTTKTQFLFRINKGIKDISDNDAINKFLSDEKRRIPFSRIIYLGDGETDVPCMKLVKERGGNSIAVYAPRKIKSKKVSEQLLKDGRACFISEADYKENSRLDLIVKTIISNISNNLILQNLKK